MVDRKRKAGILTLLLVFGLFLLPWDARAVDSIASGGCGYGLTWVLDMNGVLTISGAGDMTDYGPSYAENISLPWSAYRADIKRVVVEEGVKSIGNRAFQACNNLREVALPDSLERIGEHAFENCASLAAIQLPDLLTEIGEYAFSGCQALTGIVIPAGVTVIAEDAFAGCVALTDVTIPEGVTTVDRNAFKYCPALTRIVLPESVTSVGRNAFDECENLGHILYTGTQEQWTAVALRYGALPEGAGITYEYVGGMDYHVFENDCATTCVYCDYSREAGHAWNDGVDNGDGTVTFTCTVCGEIRVDGTTCVPTEPTRPTETTISTEPSLSATEPTESTAPSASQPGTSEPSGNGGIVVLLAVILIAGIGVVLLVVKKKT